MNAIVFCVVAVFGLSSVVGWTNFSSSDPSSQADRLTNPVNETLPSDPQARTSEKLDWVRGTVVSQSPDSLTLKLQDKSLTLSLDAATEIINGPQTGALAVGSIVEAHYLSRHDQNRAVVIIEDANSPQSLSKRPGSSYRGIVKTVRKTGMSFRIDRRILELSLDARTILVDRSGHQLARGSKDITPLLSAGDSLLVTYNVEMEFTYLSETFTPNYWETALEIRKL